MKNRSTYPLRLPRSVKAEVERRAKQDAISVNRPRRRESAGHGYFTAFSRVMRRKGAEPVAQHNAIA